MGIMSKSIMDELSSEAEADDHDAWSNKAVRNHRVWLVLFDNMEVDIVKVVFGSF